MSNTTPSFFSGLRVLVLFCVIAGLQCGLFEYNMTITRDMLVVDGLERLVYLINGEFPGPTLEVSVGDRVVITVNNLELPHESIVMHFHGIDQFGTPWYDGAAYVTNCPIVFGTPFVYDFSVSHTGTFWYHSHVGSSRMDGTYGLFIVHETDTTRTIQPFDYDAEVHIILSDWYHTPQGDIDAGLLMNEFRWPGNGNAVLVNGKGECQECPYVYPTPSSIYGTQTCQGRRHNILIQPNKTYLLRLVNAASLAYYNFAIAGHNMTVVGADASYTVKSTQQSVDVGPGMRLSVLVSTDRHSAPLDDSELYTYSIQVQSDWRGNDTTRAGIGYAHWTYASTATINYAEASDSVDSTVSEVVSPIPPPNESRNWSDWNAVLNMHINDDGTTIGGTCPPNSAVSNTVMLTVQQQYVDVRTGKGLIPPRNTSGVPHTVMGWTLHDNAKQVMSTTPHLLERYFDTTVDGRTTYDNDGTPPIRLELGSVVDIVVQNSIATNGVCEQHPWHLHGHDFHVVGQGSGKYDAATAEAIYNTINPPLVDSIVGYPSSSGNQRAHGGNVDRGVWMEPCGWITLRFTADNPGMWLFHCHIDWHLVMGMSIVFDIASEMVDRYPSDYSLCGSAISRAALELEKCESNVLNEADDDNGYYGTAGQTAVIVVCVLVTFVGTLLVVFGALYLMGTGYVPTRGKGPLLSSSSPLARGRSDSNTDVVELIREEPSETGAEGGSQSVTPTGKNML